MNNTTNQRPRMFVAVQTTDYEADELEVAERQVEAQRASCSYAEAVARCAQSAYARHLSSPEPVDCETFAATWKEYERTKDAAVVERHKLAAAQVQLEIEREARLTARLSAEAERAAYTYGRARTARCERAVALVRDRVRRSCWTLSSSPPPPVAPDLLALCTTRDHGAGPPRRPHTNGSTSQNHSLQDRAVARSSFRLSTQPEPATDSSAHLSMSSAATSGEASQ